MRYVGLPAILLAGLLSGCSGTRIIPVSPTPTDDSGDVVLVLSRHVGQVTVTVDGQPYLDAQGAKRVELLNVPSGQREVRLIVADPTLANPLDETYSLVVEPGQVSTQVVNVGARSQAAQWGAVIGGALLILVLLT
jgi:hypothetical protein